MLRTLKRSPCLDAALEYTRKGWVAVPLCPPDHANCRSTHKRDCKNPGKVPLLANWQSSPLNAEQLQAMWTTNPTANVGVVMGSFSGLCCLDIDGEEGHALFREISNGIIPDTIQFNTGRGIRYIFALPDDLDPPYKKWKNAVGVESMSFLAEGHQTVMPPSIHESGVEYAWVEGCRPGECSIEPLPMWLYNAVIAKDAPKESPRSKASPPTRERTPIENRARAFLAKCDGAISGQGGHNQTFKVACKLVHGFGLDDETTFALLWDDYNPKCEPPWTEKELRHKVESARAKGTARDYANEPRRNDPPPPPPQNEAQAEGEEDEDATAEDLFQAGSKIDWLWNGWIPKASLVCLAAEEGIGKTRLMNDLARRLYHALPMPDGQRANFAAGAKLLWVAADSQHPELTDLPEQFGFPRNACVLNASRSNPYGGTMLDSEGDLRDLERRISRVKPAMVIIDTSTNATDRGNTKSDDAKAFFVPLAKIAQRTGTSIICVTHLNAGGEASGKTHPGASASSLSAGEARPGRAAQPPEALRREVVRRVPGRSRCDDGRQRQRVRQQPAEESRRAGQGADQRGGEGQQAAPGSRVATREPARPGVRAPQGVGGRWTLRSDHLQGKR